MTRILLAMLGFYKRWLSPAWHSIALTGCKFQPTCAEYAASAIAIHGAMRGCALAFWRLMRCHPFTRGGFDPVPLPKGRTDVQPRSGTSLPSEPLP